MRPSSVNSLNSAPISVPSATEWAWLAGLIDGEGHVTLALNRHQVPSVAHVGIAMTHGPTMARVKALFGGSLNFRPRADPKHRAQWVVRWNGASARQILRQTVAYMTTKRLQARLVLGTPVRPATGPDRSTLSESEIEQRCLISAALSYDRWRQHSV